MPRPAAEGGWWSSTPLGCWGSDSGYSQGLASRTTELKNTKSSEQNALIVLGFTF